MNSHPDREHLKALEMPTHKPWERLRKEADRMLESGESTITSGEPGEESLREWEAYGFHVREYPERDIDAPLDLVRVSVGGVAGEMGYLVFRGPVSEVKWVLQRALNALRSTP